MSKEQTLADVRIENHGTIFLFYPMTPEADDWLDANIRSVTDGVWAGQALVVEHRYAWDIAQGMIGDGLRVI